jgi:hypothetical protein
MHLLLLLRGQTKRSPKDTLGEAETRSTRARSREDGPPKKLPPRERAESIAFTTAHKERRKEPSKRMERGFKAFCRKNGAKLYYDGVYPHRAIAVWKSVATAGLCILGKKEGRRRRRKRVGLKR